MLSRSGVSVGTGLTATLLSFMGTMVGLLLMGLYSLLVSGVGASGVLFLAPVWTLTAIAAAAPPRRRLAGSLPRRAGRALADGLARGCAGPAPSSTGGRRVRPARLPPRPDGRHDGPTRGPPLHLSRGRRALPSPRQGVLRGGLPAQRELPPRAGADAVPLRALPRRRGRGRCARSWRRRWPSSSWSSSPRRRGAPASPREPRSRSWRTSCRPGIAPHYNLLWRFSTTYLAALAGFLCLGRAFARHASRITPRQPEPR